MGLCYSLPNQSLEKATLDTRPEFSLKGVHTYGKILRVYDGDTAWVSVNSPIATTWRVRLLGIDTEEMRQPKDAENREEKISLAFAARNRLAQLTTDVHVDLDCRLKSKDWNELIAKNRKLIWVEFGDSDKYGRPRATFSEKTRYSIGKFNAGRRELRSQVRRKDQVLRHRPSDFSVKDVECSNNLCISIA